MIQCQIKLKLRPAQERQLNRWLFRLTGVWNWAIKKIEADASHGVYYSRYGFQQLLNGHSLRMGIPLHVLQGVADQAYDAWKRCYSRQNRPPRLKGRRNRLNSIPTTHGLKRPVSDRIGFPGMPRLRFHKQEIQAGRIGCARIVKRALGWYLCLFIQAEPAPIALIANGEVGVDPGFSSLLTTSAGEVVDHPDELRATEARIGQAQRGTRTRLVARLHERTANQRKDRNHKLSRRLVAENRLIAWSKDTHGNLARRFGKSVTSASHYQLRSMLAYKSRAGGREFVEVASRNSTRTCSVCLARTGPTGWAGLKVRHWTCAACGAAHERDVNAAQNTLRVGRGMRHESRREAVSGISTVSNTEKFISASGALPLPAAPVSSEEQP